MSRRRFPLLLLACVLASFVVLSGAPGAQAPAASRYRILITNDDGVRAPGILAAARALSAIGDITIVAPAENQSAKGHSISITDPIFADAVTLPGDLPATALTATPASCVKVGVEALMPQKPDLVVSGINRGYNLGYVTYVSGTVGAAREAALMGIPAIAASLAIDQPDYTTAANIVRQVAGMVRKNGLEPGAFLNVNVPPASADAIKGIHLTRQSAQTGVERFEEQKSPNGRRYFWNVWNEPTGDVEGTDVWAVEHGFVAVTPLHVGEFDPRTYDAWRKVLAR